MALSEVLSPAVARRLIACCGSAAGVFSATADAFRDSELRQANAIWEKLKSCDLRQYEDRLLEMRRLGIRFVRYDDTTYPKQLKEIASYPLLLFYKGDLSVVNRRPVLAVVGTRNMTGYGQRVLRSWIPLLVARGVVIVSGLAYGVDGLAHGLCVEAGGLTVAVQAQGVERGYPRRQQELYENILKNNGCVVSEFPFVNADWVEKFHFPRRNRLISGLSRGVLVVEAGEKSGALITARYGLDQNREVYAVPGSLFQNMSQGCLNLIRQGAKPVMCVEDILEDFGLVEQKSDDKMPLPLTDERIPTDQFETPLERSIYELCRQCPQTMDAIIERVREPAPFVSATITKMQLSGRLQEAPGRRFVVVD